MKSYAHLFYFWLVPNLTSHVFSQCANIHPDDLAGLRGFYKYTYGDQWTETDGWDQIVSNRPIRYCDLDNILGLEFSTGKVRRVIKINLHNYNVSGELADDSQQF